NVDPDASEALYWPTLRYALALETLGQVDAAHRHFTQAIRISENHFGPFNPDLVEALTGHGRTLIAQGRYEEAETSLLQAQSITHRNAGVFTTEQIIILRHLSQAYTAQGKLIAADKVQRLALAVFEDTYGDTPELVPALQDWAKWNARLSRFAKVSDSLNKALEILEQAYGPNDMRLVETLDLIVKLYRFHPSRGNAVDGQRALRRIAKIYANQPYVDQADLLKARTRIGDWYMLAQANTHAIAQYSRVIEQSVQDNVDQQLIDDFFGDPKMLFVDRSRREFWGKKISGATIDPGYLIVQYDVRKNGRTANFRVVEDTMNNPAMSKAALAKVESAIFRPRFENGKPVDTQGLRILFEIKPGGKGLEFGSRFVDKETQTNR
ncbi:MAG: tetratricopeptide repeat protein, partial [Gammaproteobacteria bacterium]|nr:tetratricopeptide repeat protein [Gammaproteobacteria bacterium]